MKSDKLTILLVLKGRHKFTDRWLSFANTFLSNYKIIAGPGQGPRRPYSIKF